MTFPIRRALAITLIILLAAAGGFYAFGHHGGQGRAQLQTATITAGDIQEEVTAQGKLEPKDYVDVGTQVSGQLSTLHVELGDDVQKGQLLAEIDPRLYESKVQADTAHLHTLQAQLMQQQAQTELARQQAARNDKLLKQDAVSKDEWDQSRAALKAAVAAEGSLKAQIDEVNSDLEGDNTNLGYTKIFAPISGTVVSTTAREGQTLNANQTAPVILQLANLDIMTVRAQVAEADVMRLKTGMTVEFSTLGNLDKRWQATVRQISPSPENVNDVILFDVLIDADNKDRQLMDGMSTQVYFVLGKSTNVPLIPIGALGARAAAQDQGDDKAYQVTVLNADGKPEQRAILTGLSNRVSAEVKDGLQAGDKVVIKSADSDKPKTGAAGGARGFGGGPRL